MKFARATGIVILLFIAHAGLAQNYPSLFWEISGNGLTKPSYLYGTMHSFDSRVFRFTKQLDPFIKKCDVFALELDLDVSSLTGMAQYIMLGGDTTLAMLIDSVHLDKLNRFMADSLGVPLAFLMKVKPFFIMGIMMEEGTEKDEETFLDDHLSQMAKKHKKKVIGLETMEEQAQAIDGIPLSEQTKMLLDAVDSALVGASGGEMDDMVAVYEKANLDSLYELYKKEDLSNEFNASLITRRNHRMADRFATYADGKHSIFAAVGALHLPGKEGVIELLRAKGYTVKPIPLK
jgi:hypothetical protein